MSRSPRRTPPKPAGAKLGDASAEWDGQVLTVRAAALERAWRWTDAGPATVSLRNAATGRQWVPRAGRGGGDWDILPPGERCGGRLVSLEARCVRRSPWTSDHVEVVAEVRFGPAGLRVQWLVWVYPGAAGVRTQLRLRALPGRRCGGLGRRRSEFVPALLGGLSLRAAGYYNETQQRNRPDTPLLREEVFPPPAAGRAKTIDWASLLSVEAGGEGLWLVKESHKCVNQPGVDTGAFRCRRGGVEVTGLGPGAGDLRTGRFRDCWATWCVLWAGGDSERQQAVKAFDRQRYPVDPKRDIFVMANTWGSSDDRRQAQAAAAEPNVLGEIDSAADLGIDVQQIDDGWQGGRYRRWRPCRSRYPRGWATVRAHARRRGITLGLWAAVRIGTADLLRNFDEGGFRYFKLDFAHLDTFDELERTLAKARRLIEHSGHTVRVNWDVTENSPRVGYFFARELGNIYLANRKPAWPREVVYVPALVLRDAWQLARYANLNQFQLTVQNVDRVDRARSDAHRHGHDYCLAITLMGSPIFFQETHYLGPDARGPLRDLLAVYRRHRREMFTGTVFPIGDEPDGSRWSGFQCHLPGGAGGYLTVFRPRRSRRRVRSIGLHFLRGGRLRLTDLPTGRRWTAGVSRSGHVRFEIDRAAGFLFLRYERP